jgi:hypothetical protein
MKNENQRRLDPYVFESRDVIRFAGIPATYLNKFIEHRSFGIKPSIREGSGRGTRRLFSDEDALGIALVWSLFQVGLRSRVIAQVLEAILEGPGGPQGLATEAAGRLDAECAALNEPKVLVIRRSLGRSRKNTRSLQVWLDDKDYVEPRSDVSSELIIPISMVFAEVKKKIQQFKR